LVFFFSFFEKNFKRLSVYICQIFSMPTTKFVQQGVMTLDIHSLRSDLLSVARDTQILMKQLIFAGTLNVKPD